ncbi:MAG: Bug family tripartite tricarboxylate transporter substrate binding protein [Lautropia sp.]
MLRRRRWVGRALVSCAGLLPLLAATGALAQSNFPTQPIRLLVPQAAGGSTDTLARTIGSRLADVLGQPVVIENRAGANGIIGSELVARAKPDGYTLLVGGTGTMAINQNLYTKLSYDPEKDFVPVAMFGYSTSVLVVNPAVPASTIGELIVQAKAKPGELRYASAGIGSSPHLTAEMFRQMAGVDVMHVPYKGSTPGVIATISGETAMMFTGVASALQQIRAGRLKALSISGPRRSPALPEVPTASESGLPGFEADFWIGLFAPVGTPSGIVERINTEVNRILEAPAMRESLTAKGVEVLPVSTARFAEILSKDVARWATTIKAAGVTAN